MLWVFHRETENDFLKRIKNFQNHFLFMWEYGCYFSSTWFLLTLKPQFHKMVKHTQTIGRQIGDKLFECVWPFCGLALKGLTNFWPMFTFLTLPENTGISLVFWCFYWVQNANISQKWVKAYRKASGIGLLHSKNLVQDTEDHFIIHIKLRTKTVISPNFLLSIAEISF